MRYPGTLRYVKIVKRVKSCIQLCLVLDHSWYREILRAPAGANIKEKLDGFYIYSCHKLKNIWGSLFYLALMPQECNQTFPAIRVNLILASQKYETLQKYKTTSCLFSRWGKVIMVGKRIAQCNGK